MTITITGDQGYLQFKPAALAANVDATDATFHTRHDPDFLYPIDIRNASAGLTFLMGKMAGEVNQTDDWSKVYARGNGAALLILGTANFTVLGGWFDKGWDCFRPAQSGCDGWLVEGVMATDFRDDFIEDDACNSGTIRDCLCDGAFVSCISTTGGNSSTRNAKTVTIEDSLFRSKGYLYQGQAGQHSAPFKANSAGINYNPKFVVRRCVFAIENPGHLGIEPGGRLHVAFAGMTVTDSFWLNLSDTPISAAYRMMIPAGFTLLQGQPARDLWAARRSAWRVAHGYDPAPDPDPEDPEMEARIAALAAQVAALTATLAAMQAELTALAVLQTRVAALEVFDTRVKDL